MDVIVVSSAARAADVTRLVRSTGLHCRVIWPVAEKIHGVIARRFFVDYDTPLWKYVDGATLGAHLKNRQATFGDKAETITCSPEEAIEIIGGTQCQNAD